MESSLNLLRAAHSQHLIKIQHALQLEEDKRDRRIFFPVLRYEPLCEGPVFSDMSENRQDFCLSRRALMAFLLTVGSKLGEHNSESSGCL